MPLHQAIQLKIVLLRKNTLEPAAWKKLNVYLASISAG